MLLSLMKIFNGFGIYIVERPFLRKGNQGKTRDYTTFDLIKIRGTINKNII